MKTCRLHVYIPMSFFSWMNLTLDKTSADSSMAWLNPFSPPYDTSTNFKTLPCNLCGEKKDKCSLHETSGLPNIQMYWKVPNRVYVLFSATLQSTEFFTLNDHTLCVPYSVIADIDRPQTVDLNNCFSFSFLFY